MRRFYQSIALIVLLFACSESPDFFGGKEPEPIIEDALYQNNSSPCHWNKIQFVQNIPIGTWVQCANEGKGENIVGHADERWTVFYGCDGRPIKQQVVILNPSILYGEITGDTYHSTGNRYNYVVNYKKCYNKLN
jgi:hypothetical protein